MMIISGGGAVERSPLVLFPEPSIPSEQSLIKATDTFEYEYQDKDHKPIPVPSTSSRNNTASTLARPSVPTDQYTGRDYTTDRNTVERLTNALESTTLEPTAITISSNHPHPQAHVTTKNSKENSENFDPRKPKRSSFITNLDKE